MDYILLFVSIFLSITSIILSAFLFIRIEKICDKNAKLSNYKSQKKKLKISGLLIKKSNYTNIILKTEKKYFYNITGFIGLFFLFVGLLFFAGFAFYQVLPLTRIVLLYIFSICLLAISYYLQKNNQNNYAVILKTLSGAILLLAAVGSSRFKILEWTENTFLIYIITAISVLINIFIAYYRGGKNSDKIHVLMTLFSLSLMVQTQYIFYIAALFSIITVFISYRKKDLVTIYLISILYFAYQIFLFHFYFSNFNNCYILASNIIIFIMQFMCYQIKPNNNIKFQQKMICYLFNLICFFIILLHYSVNKEVKETLLILSALTLYFFTRKVLKSVSIYIRNINLIVFVGLFLYAFYSLKEFNFENAFILCISIVFLYLFLFIENNNKILFKILTLILFIYSLSLIYLASQSINKLNSEITYFCFISIITGIGFINCNRKNYNEVDIYSEISWFIIGLIPSAIITAYLISMQFTFKNYLLLGILLTFFTIISFGIQKSSLKYGQVLSVLIFCFNGLFNIESAYNLSGNIYIYLPFILIPVINLFYYSDNNNLFCRSVSMFTLFSSLIWIVYKIYYKISAPLPGVIFLFMSLISFEIGDLVSKTKIKILFRLRNNLYLWGILLSYLFIVFYLAVILNSEKYFDISGLNVQVRFIIEIIASIVFLYYILSKRKITNIIIERLNELNIEILLFLIILTIKSQIQRIYHSPIWIVISLLIFIMGNYFRDKAWRLKLYSIFFCWASMIQTAFYIGTKVSVDKNFYKQGWFLGIIAICLQSIFVILVRKYNFLDCNSSPIEAGFLKRIKDQIQNKYNMYMYYSLFICIGFFIYASFDKSFISVLWLLEAFYIYIVGIIHKDKALRVLSIFFLLFCVLRMITIDLKEENLLIKSAVFFLSGIIIILVNMIYKNKVLKNEN